MRAVVSKNPEPADSAGSPDQVSLGICLHIVSLTAAFIFPWESLLLHIEVDDLVTALFRTITHHQHRLALSLPHWVSLKSEETYQPPFP